MKAFLGLKKIYETSNNLFQVLQSLIESDERVDFILSPDIIVPKPGYASSVIDYFDDYFDKVQAVERLLNMSLESLPSETQSCLSDIAAMRGALEGLDESKLTLLNLKKNAVLCGPKYRISTLVHDDLFERHYENAVIDFQDEFKLGNAELTVARTLGKREHQLDDFFVQELEKCENPAGFLLELFDKIKNSIEQFDFREHHCGAALCLSLLVGDKMYVLQFGDCESHIYSHDSARHIQQASTLHNFYHPFEFMRQYQIANLIPHNPHLLQAYHDAELGRSAKEISETIVTNLNLFHRNSFGLGVSRCFYSHKDIMEVGCVPEINCIDIDYSHKQTLVMCTDGVTEIVPVADIINWSIIRDTDFNAKIFVDLSTTAGSEDNQTALCMDIEAAPQYPILIGFIDSFGHPALGQAVKEIAISMLEATKH